VSYPSLRVLGWTDSPPFHHANKQVIRNLEKYQDWYSLWNLSGSALAERERGTENMICSLPWKWEDVFRQNADIQRTFLYDRSLSCFHKAFVHTVVAFAWFHFILEVQSFVVRIYWQPCFIRWESYQNKKDWHEWTVLRCHSQYQIHDIQIFS